MVPQNDKDDAEFGYFIQGGQQTLSESCQTPCARLFRTQWSVIRTSDRKVMAEHFYYTRGVGYWLEGVPGVGHGKPGPVPMDFGKRVFIKE